MACPMRVVLVAVSLAIAAFVALWCSEEHPHIDDDTDHVCAREPKSKKSLTQHVRQGLGFLWQAFTGKYLWTKAKSAYQHRRRKSSQQAVKAA